MSDETESDEVGGLSDEEEQEQLFENLSRDEREEVLRNARWNVYLFLGIAAIFFAGALFPWPFTAVDDNFSSSAEKDLGLLMGLPIPGDDAFDVPLTLDVDVVEPPTTANVQVGVYIIQEKDCTSPAMAEKEATAREGTEHNFQFQMKKAIAGETLTFEFDVDPGEYCAKVLYVTQESGTGIISGADQDGRAKLSVKGGIWQLQSIFGIVGLCCLSLSIFAFLGAQKNGKLHRKILESDPNTIEQQVLSSVIAAGPSGPPPSGPSGPPPSGPAGPPPSAGHVDAVEAEEAAPTEPHTEPTAQPPIEKSHTELEYVGTGDGYYYIRNPDGSFDQTPYVLNNDGQYIPYSA